MGFIAPTIKSKELEIYMKSHARLTTFIIGEGTLPVQCGELLLQRDHEVYGVITSDPTLSGWANKLGIPQIGSSADFAETMSQQPFDYLFSIGNYKVLPDRILSLPKKGAINFHDSPLPKYAGANATSWALMNRETVHGVTWHSMTAQVDGGNIVKARAVNVSSDDTAFTLNVKCYEAAILSFAELLDDLAQGLDNSGKQNAGSRSYYHLYQRPPAACTVSWNRPAEDIEAFVRALDFGNYPNPIGLPKIAAGAEFVVIVEAGVIDQPTPEAPGTVTEVGRDSIKVAASRGQIAVRRVLGIDGDELSIQDLIARYGLQRGYCLVDLDSETASRATALYDSVSRNEAFWVRRLASLQPFTLPSGYQDHTLAKIAGSRAVPIFIPDEVTALLGPGDSAIDRASVLMAVFGLFLSRIGEASCFDLRLKDLGVCRGIAGLEGLFSLEVPLRIEAREGQTFLQFLSEFREELSAVKRHGTFARDVSARYPALAASRGLRDLNVGVAIVEGLNEREPLPTNGLTLEVTPRGDACRFVYDAGVISSAWASQMAGWFTALLREGERSPNRLLGDLSLLAETERRQVLVEWNDTATDYPRDKCINDLFEAEAARSPESIAVVFEEEQVTYGELNRRSNELAHELIDLGVGPDVLVALCAERSIELFVGLLAILKAGGAYVPLDPSYPTERLAFMLEDSRAAVLLTQRRLTREIPAPTHARVVYLDEERAGCKSRQENPARAVKPDNLAYVIYTSGSTGRPKGVMVRHQNVVNFFTAMDEKIGRDRHAGVWLAVTSVSFDISILELFWTLSRGFKVVLGSVPLSRPATQRRLDFSLAYFASEGGEPGEDKYRLLIEGAKFADQHGFLAVWTPERHFHAFGGLYPNPSVISAAIAAVTERVQIRAGSVVLPLHNPIRVAEDWSVVDNLSKGRVGVSFASGWHADDFVLEPESYSERKAITTARIDTVRKLWRGDAVSFRGGDGELIPIRILPRPVQANLPIWITAAANPDTFRLAGEMGANLLTHLLGQSVEELAEKIELYREAWRRGNHGPREGQVTVMVHTYVAGDPDSVREKVRAPLINYLRSSVDLLKKFASSFPAFSRSRSNGAGGSELERLSEEDRETLLSHAFERYFGTSGLFGTPSSCVHLIDILKAAGVDEVACLIDFGIDADSVIESLHHLDSLRQYSNLGVTSAGEDYSIAAQIRRHRVTHMQCTPSMASMLVADPDAVEALRSLKKLLVGGEALPPSLAAQLQSAVSGDVCNMYGPTETTIWSTTYDGSMFGELVPIGRPVANTQVYILDWLLQPVPAGVAGEIFIGGAGVAGGYLNQPELTAEKFIRDPFSDASDARMYRTGDRGRFLLDGNIQFLGRVDNQVKLRGHRIEIEEIEKTLSGHGGVDEAVVTLREDKNGGQQLVAYVVRGFAALRAIELGSFLKAALPGHMVPSSFVFLNSIPRTPNGKVDRQLLLAAEPVKASLRSERVAPSNVVEEVLAAIWASMLNVEDLDVNDNFFELGGHSLIAVQLISRLRDVFKAELPLRTLFDAPTIRLFAQRLTLHESVQGQTERIARVLGKVQLMSQEEVRQELQERRVAEGVA